MLNHGRRVVILSALIFATTIFVVEFFEINPLRSNGGAWSIPHPSSGIKGAANKMASVPIVSEGDGHGSASSSSDDRSSSSSSSLSPDDDDSDNDSFPKPIGVETTNKGDAIDIYDPKETDKVIQWYIGGFAKCGTSFLLHQVFYPAVGTFTGKNGEVPLKGNVTKFLDHYKGHYPRTQHFTSTTQLDSDDKKSTLIQNGFKAPHTIDKRLNIENLHTYLPHAKQIFSVRHPLDQFKSHFNYNLRITDLQDIPEWELDPEQLIGYGMDLCSSDSTHNNSASFPEACLDFEKYPCSKSSKSSCAGRVATHLLLSRLGYTPRTSPDERALLQNHDLPIYNFNATTQMHLIELGQLFLDNVTRVNGLIENLEDFLQLAPGGLPRFDQSDQVDDYQRVPILERKGMTEEKIPYVLENLCEPKHQRLHDFLMEVSVNASEWMEHYLLESPNVVVYDKPDFVRRLRRWKISPCDKQKQQQNDSNDALPKPITTVLNKQGKPDHVYAPRALDPVIQFFVGGFERSGAGILLRRVLGPAKGTFLGKEDGGELPALRSNVTKFLSYYQSHYPRTQHFESSSLSDLESGTLIQNGFVMSHALDTSPAIERIHRYLPHAKQIISLRHPVELFKSIYNHNLQTATSDALKHELNVAKMIGYGMNLCVEPELFPEACMDLEAYPCSEKGNSDLCAGKVATHLTLSRLGYTPMSSSRERDLLQHHNLPLYSFNETTKLHLVELSQLFVDDITQVNGVIESLESFLELAPGGLPRLDLSEQQDEYTRIPVEEWKGMSKKKIRSLFNPCEKKHQDMHDFLMEISVNASEWIEHYLLQSDRVVVHDRQDFLRRIRQWKVSPCEVEKSLLPQPLGTEMFEGKAHRNNTVEVFDPEETDKVIQFMIGGFAKSGTSFLMHEVFWPSRGTFIKNQEVKDFKIPNTTAHFLHFAGHYPRNERFTPSTSSESLTYDKSSTLVQNGFKSPHAVTDYNQLHFMEKYIPHAKQILTIRGPVSAYESHYNFKLRTERFFDEYDDGPPNPDKMVGFGGSLCYEPERFPEACLDFDRFPCSKMNYIDCAGRTAVHLFISQLGYTPMTSKHERDLLMNHNIRIFNFSATTTLHINELSQLFFNNITRLNGVIGSMESFLGLAPGGLPRIDQSKEETEYVKTNRTEIEGIKGNETKLKHVLLICEDRHKPLRDHLVEIGTNASEWIEHYLLKSDRVFVHDREDFIRKIRKWSVDPCLKKN